MKLVTLLRHWFNAKLCPLCGHMWPQATSATQCPCCGHDVARRKVSGYRTPSAAESRVG